MRSYPKMFHNYHNRNVSICH